MLEVTNTYSVSGGATSPVADMGSVVVLLWIREPYNIMLTTQSHLEMIKVLDKNQMYQEKIQYIKKST